MFHDFLLGKIREKDPSKVWLKDESLGRVETFGRVAGSVAKMASAINKLGIAKDDVICMFCANYVEYWLLCLAGWSCGACIMPVNCEIDIEQLREQLVEARVTVRARLHYRHMAV